jgi:mRNA interferase MazF
VVGPGLVERGEVWWHEPPDEKARPVLVLTRQAGVDVMSRVLAVPATTTVRGIPTEVALEADDGMPKTCVLNLDNLAPVRKAHLTRFITKLGPTRMAEVCAAMGRATDCP